MDWQMENLFFENEINFLERFLSESQSMASFYL